MNIKDIKKPALNFKAGFLYFPSRYSDYSPN